MLLTLWRNSPSEDICWWAIVCVIFYFACLKFIWVVVLYPSYIVGTIMYVGMWALSFSDRDVRGLSIQSGYALGSITRQGCMRAQYPIWVRPRVD